MKMFDAIRFMMTTQLSDREIGVTAGLSKTTVGRYRRIAAAKGLTWESVSALEPDALSALFNRPAKGGSPKQAPDLAILHEQLQGKGATLQVWWENYRREDPYNTLSYSQLASKLKNFRETLPTVMRQYHVPGERLFVDYSGDRPHYIDQATRLKMPVELFVGVLPASSLMFAICTASQQVPDFIRAHVAMLDYFGGAPQIIVPDNLKSGVTTPGKFPVIQRSYADMARHYGIAIVPARPYKPRDKAAVEAGVKFAQQRILARLRHQHLYSLDELNAEVAKLLEELNGRPMTKDAVSRRTRFEAIERSSLVPLPTHPFVYSQWVAIPKVPRDYHVNVGGHFYSVPHALVGAKLNAGLTDKSVEIMQGRRCVAKHKRNSAMGAHTTNPKHQTEPHRAYAERTPEGMTAWAKTAGTSVLRFVEHQLDRPQPCHGLVACDSLRLLAMKHGTTVLDEAARMSFELRTPTITILKRLVENATVSIKKPQAPRSSYARGPEYYAQVSPC